MTTLYLKAFKSYPIFKVGDDDNDNNDDADIRGLNHSPPGIINSVADKKNPKKCFTFFAISIGEKNKQLQKCVSSMLLYISLGRGLQAAYRCMGMDVDGVLNHDEVTMKQL